MFQCCMCTLPSYDCPPPPHVSMYDRWVWPVSDMYDRWAWTVSDMYDRWAWTVGEHVWQVGVTCEWHVWQVGVNCEWRVWQVGVNCEYMYDRWVWTVSDMYDRWVTCGRPHLAPGACFVRSSLNMATNACPKHVARRKGLRSEKYDFPGVWPGMDKRSWMTWTRRSPSLPTKIGSKAPYTRQFEWRWTKCIGMVTSMHSWWEGNWYICIIV